MKIFIGTDHAGYVLKEKLVATLKAQGREVSKDSNNTRGIILGATGQGEAVAANKFPYVRTVVYYGEAPTVVDDEADVIVRSREHNNSNVLSLAARYLTEEMALKAVDLWLKTPFSQGERHIRRLGKIDQIKI